MLGTGPVPYSSVNQGSELCQAIVDPPKVRSHLSEGMQMTTLRHTEIAVLRAVVSSTMQSVLGRSPTEACRVYVVDELLTAFWEQEECCCRI
jgi:hypothetical protein